MSTAPIAQGPVDVTVGLLTEAADELAWLHREYLSRSPLSEGVPRITRLLQKIEAHTGHVTASPYLPPNVEVRGAARGGVKRRAPAYSASPRLPG